MVRLQLRVAEIKNFRGSIVNPSPWRFAIRRVMADDERLWGIFTRTVCRRQSAAKRRLQTVPPSPRNGAVRPKPSRLLRLTEAALSVSADGSAKQERR